MLNPEGADDAIRETAEKCYWLIGDTPELAEDGGVFVYESGEELTRLIYPFEEG